MSPLPLPHPFKLSRRPTLKELQPIFEQTRRMSTIRTVSHAITQFVDFVGQDREPQHVYRVDADTWVAHLEEARKLKPATVRSYKGCVSGFWDWMVDHKLVSDNPFRREKIILY